jgi:hypothetical protein
VGELRLRNRALPHGCDCCRVGGHVAL